MSTMVSVQGELFTSGGEQRACPKESECNECHIAITLGVHHTMRCSVPAGWEAIRTSHTTGSCNRKIWLQGKLLNYIATPADCAPQDLSQKSPRVHCHTRPCHLDHMPLGKVITRTPVPPARTWTLAYCIPWYTYIYRCTNLDRATNVWSWCVGFKG